jgi:hypothetical protein
MDWDLAIERNREQLLRIVEVLFAMIGLSQGASVERLSKHLYRTVLQVLRPAEWAVRRLIVVAARGMAVKPSKARKAAGKAKRTKSRKGSGLASFPLFDPRVHYELADGLCPTGAGQKPTPASPAFAPKEKDTVDAKPLCRRLAAIKAALQDLASQARRYARWRAKPYKQRRPKLFSTLRPGPPPRFRKRPRHEVHDILRECHWLARNLLEPDTS